MSALGWGTGRARRRREDAPLHLEDPSAPGVHVRVQESPWASVGSTLARWHVLGRDLDAAHLVGHAATGVGKNQVLLNACFWNILAHRPESVFVADPKGDMVDEFLQRTSCPQFVYTFLERHDSCSAINLIATPEMARAAAASLYPVGKGEPIWNQGARRLFTALAEALGYSRSNVVELYRAMLDPERLAGLASRCERVRRAMSAQSKNMASSLLQSAAIPLAPLEDERVARAFAPAPDAPQPDFLAKQVVYLCLPDDPDEVEALGPLGGALIANLVRRATKAKRGTYFLIDEAGSLCTVANLASYLSMARSQGAYFFLILQDVAQLRDRLGRERADSALGNADAQFFGKTNETSTAAYLSELSGTLRVRRRVYRDEGWTRTLKQLFSEGGAPYDLREELRRRVEPGHLYDLPPGSFYAWAGDSEGMELVHALPWWRWRDRVLPEPVEPLILGLPGGDPGEPEEDPAPGPPARLLCASCGSEAPPAARFCPSCGAVLAVGH